MISISFLKVSGFLTLDLAMAFMALFSLVTLWMALNTAPYVPVPRTSLSGLN